MRVPFDNGVFDPVRPEVGRFFIEEDGTITLWSVFPGGDEAQMTLARLRRGHEPWQVIQLKMPAAVLSSVAVYGERILFTDGYRIRGSVDGGKTFQDVAKFARGYGVFRRCNALGCSFKEYEKESLTRLILRRWSRDSGQP